jgi:hypothetical protein
MTHYVVLDYIQINDICCEKYFYLGRYESLLELWSIYTGISGSRRAWYETRKWDVCDDTSLSIDMSER